MSKKKKEEFMSEMNVLGKRLSDVSIQFHHMIAERAGLSGADHKYLNILIDNGPMTAGQLAEQTGLTTGAVTGVIDRLEKQGMIARQNDPDDRRKVILVPNLDLVYKKFGPFFESFQRRLEEVYNQFTPEQLHVIRKYLNATTEVMLNMHDEMKKIS